LPRRGLAQPHSRQLHLAAKRSPSPLSRCGVRVLIASSPSNWAIRRFPRAFRVSRPPRATSDASGDHVWSPTRPSIPRRHAMARCPMATPGDEIVIRRRRDATASMEDAPHRASRRPHWSRGRCDVPTCSPSRDAMPEGMDTPEPSDSRRGRTMWHVAYSLTAASTRATLVAAPAGSSARCILSPHDHQ
jgi:hypothetical protein